MSDVSSDSSKLKDRFKDKEHNRFEFIVAIIVNIVIWYIANNLLNWNIGFISNSFVDVLGILNLFLMVSIIINIIFIFYHTNWFRNLLLLLPDILSLNVAYAFLVVFPFNLNPLWTLILKIIIILAMIGIIISIIVHIIKLVVEIIDRDWREYWFCYYFLPQHIRWANYILANKQGI